MADDVKIVYEFKTGCWYKIWKVYFKNTLLLQTHDAWQAKRAYERYRNSPPKFSKLPCVIF